MVEANVEPPAPLAERFLVRSDQGALVIQAPGTPWRTVVVQSEVGQGAVYDAALELVWYRQSGTLKVLDIRRPELAPMTVAEGLPDVEDLFVEHDGHAATSQGACDAPFIAFHWQDAPTIDMPEPHQDDKARFVGGAWLAEQAQRPLRDVPGHAPKLSQRVRLPKSMRRCETPSDCGVAEAFGATGRWLVATHDRPGGDCRERACVLYDPATKRFATPPEAQNWGPVEQTKPGPCGPYLFNRDGTAALFYKSLCTSNGCIKLEGEGLGWLVPGVEVGVDGNVVE